MIFYCCHEVEYTMWRAFHFQPNSTKVAFTKLSHGSHRLPSMQNLNSAKCFPKRFVHTQKISSFFKFLCSISILLLCFRPACNISPTYLSIALFFQHCVTGHIFSFISAIFPRHWLISTHNLWAQVFSFQAGTTCVNPVIVSLGKCRLDLAMWMFFVCALRSA